MKMADSILANIEKIAKFAKLTPSKITHHTVDRPILLALGVVIRRLGFLWCICCYTIIHHHSIYGTTGDSVVDGNA